MPSCSPTTCRTGDLPALYAGATCFVFPSLYEGFGLPVLEAMAAGAPVVAARAGSIPEVAGDAALLVDARVPGELATAIEAVLTDGALRERLIARGRARAAQFDWNTVARRTLAVYDAVYRRREPRMKLAFDARKIDDFGIGTYIQGLLDALPAVGRPEALVAYLPPGRPPSALAAAAWGARARWQPVAAGTYSVRELWQLALAARRDRVDLYHAPHYVCPPWLPCPAVVTVHDLIHLRFPVRHRHPLAPLYARLMLRLAVRRARRLITVSESTRRDLVERLGARPERIRVIPNGVGAPFGPADAPGAAAPTLDELGVSRPYFLFVGNPLPHKNVTPAPRRLRRAPAGARPPRAGRDSAGGPRPASTSAVPRPASEAACASWPRCRRPSWRVSTRARPSWCARRSGKGSGSPRSRRWRAARPWSPRTGAGLPEVVGDAGLLVNPTDVDALREAMYTLAGQESLRAALRARGLARARAFSWRHVAEATVAVYREALGA